MSGSISWGGAGNGHPPSPEPELITHGAIKADAALYYVNMIQYDSSAEEIFSKQRNPQNNVLSVFLLQIGKISDSISTGSSYLIYI